MKVKQAEKILRILRAEHVDFCNHNGSRDVFRGTLDEARQTFRDFAEFEVLFVEELRAGGFLVWLAI